MPFDTTLSKDDEFLFQQWLSKASSLRGRDVSKDLNDYDLRGYWLMTGSKLKDITVGHLPDTYKKPNHPTFSEESIYSDEKNAGGKWKGNTFIPSPTNLKYHSKEKLKDYFSKFEKESILQFLED
jgi:hypothetical protein